MPARAQRDRRSRRLRPSPGTQSESHGRRGRQGRRWSTAPRYRTPPRGAPRPRQERTFRPCSRYRVGSDPVGSGDHGLDPARGDQRGSRRVGQQRRRIPSFPSSHMVRRAPGGAGVSRLRSSARCGPGSRLRESRRWRFPLHPSRAHRRAMGENRGSRGEQAAPAAEMAASWRLRDSMTAAACFQSARRRSSVEGPRRLRPPVPLESQHRDQQRLAGSHRGFAPPHPALHRSRYRTRPRWPCRRRPRSQGGGAPHPQRHDRFGQAGRSRRTSRRSSRGSNVWSRISIPAPGNSRSGSISASCRLVYERRPRQSSTRL